MSPRQLLARGDRAALAAAYVDFRPLVVKMLRQRGRAPSERDDLIQETFLRLPECARKCAPETSLGGCVATAVIQAVRGFDHRAATREQTRGEDPRAAAPTPEEHLDQRERVHHLSELLEGLPQRQRLILLAREIEEQPLPRLAAAHGVTVRAMQGLTFRARRELEARAALGPLAEVFAAMPKRGDGLGQSRSSRWRRRVGKTSSIMNHQNGAS